MRRSRPSRAKMWPHGQVRDQNLPPFAFTSRRDRVAVYYGGEAMSRRTGNPHRLLDGNDEESFFWYLPRNWLRLPLFMRAFLDLEKILCTLVYPSRVIDLGFRYLTIGELLLCYYSRIRSDVPIQHLGLFSTLIHLENPVSNFSLSHLKASLQTKYSCVSFLHCQLLH